MAIQECFTAPFYFLDEIDAALGMFADVAYLTGCLDTLNCERVAQFIMQATARRVAQFVVISLRPQMYECAPCIIGTYTCQTTTRSVMQMFSNTQS